MKKIRACAIVVNKGNVLLLWRKIKGKEYFVFPGGGKEINETLDEAVAREVFEETSIVVKVEKPLYKLIDENNEHNFYLCLYLSGEPKLGLYNEFLDLSEENKYEPMWKNINELTDLSVFPLEVRDWFITDYKNNFIQTPREQTIEIEQRRKI